MAYPRRLIRLYHTVKYLKIRQIVYRGWGKIYSPAIDTSPPPSLRRLAGVWGGPVPKDIHLSRPWSFTFLGVTRDCRFPADWNNPAIEKLWLYNLHYFDDLASSGAGQRQQLHTELLQRWLADNPPAAGNGWEPYPTSLRIVNWIKWILAGNGCPEQVIDSLAVQTRLLCKRLEYHLLGNHLFANGKALLFAGLFFAGAEAEGWYGKGMQILEQQLAEQILADGGHFERSPMYHAIILEDLLDCINLMTAYGAPVSDSWRDRVGSMFFWLRAMCHPDGDIALFNDAAFGIAARPEALQAYAARLGMWGRVQGLDPLVHLAESGYLRRQNADACVLIDVGEIGPEYLPGHAHADTLSFEMSLFGQRFIVDSGTSCYGVSAERLRQRQTAAHNTVAVDNQDSSEVWGGFRVARRARPMDLRLLEDAKGVTVWCSHDGYSRLPGKVVHSREWRMLPDSVVITDTLRGEYNEAFSRIHFHPDVRVEAVGQAEIAAVTADGRVVRLVIDGGSAVLHDSTYHPQFGQDVGNKCLQTTFSQRRCTLTLSWA